MSEPAVLAATPATTPGGAVDGALATGSAGALLRAARLQQGLHIVALAASIKVPPARLEALEFDRYGELTDATFTRALALSVCRVLKIDAAPVLARLPSAPATRLEQIDGGLNMPFRERPGLIGPPDSSLLRQPVLWMVALLLLGAAAFLLLPQRPLAWLSDLLPGSALVPAARPAANAPAGPAAAGDVERVPQASESRSGSATASSAGVDGAASAAAATPAATTPASLATPRALSSVASTAVPPVGAGIAERRLGLRASAPSWVQVVDADGRTLLERVLGAGEAIELDGALPMKLRIGNASGVELRFRGQPVDLAPVTSKNIAQVDLQ